MSSPRPSSNATYQPRPCAFHPKEQIFNFCRNSDCLLPLCPSCVKVHSQEHKAESSFGQFENMEKLVENIDNFMDDMLKELHGCSQDIREAQEIRNKDKQEVKRKMQEAKNKMLGLVQRFFNDFEKEVVKSMTAYNDSMKEGYGKLQHQINGVKSEIQMKSNNLKTDKVLKTVIGFYSKLQEEKYRQNIIQIRERLNELQEQKVTVVCNPNCTQKIVDQLGNYIHLEFMNWQSEIKYIAEFVKTGFSQRNSSRMSGKMDHTGCH